MNKLLALLALTNLILAAAPGMAQQKAVVIPLNTSGGAGLDLVKDSDSSVVGQVIGVDSLSRWIIINNQGFMMGVDASGWPRSETVYFTGTDCTGTPMLTLATSGSAAPANSNPVYAKQGYVFTEPNLSGIWFIAPGTNVISQAYQSRYLTSGCQNTTNTTDAIPALPNNEAVTGVPDTGYGSVSLDQ